MRFTVTELAEKFNTDKETARGFMRFMVHKGFAEILGGRRPDQGRGRAENVYSFIEGYENSLLTMLSEAK